VLSRFRSGGLLCIASRLQDTPNYIQLSPNSEAVTGPCMTDRTLDRQAHNEVPELCKHVILLK
jgi:hypothetical protein